MKLMNYLVVPNSLPFQRSLFAVSYVGSIFSWLMNGASVARLVI